MARRAAREGITVKELNSLTKVTGIGGGVFYEPATNGRRWFYRYQAPGTGRTRQMGLGTFPAVSLAQARQHGVELTREVRAGRDPLEASVRAAAPKGLSFKAAAEAYIADRRSQWRIRPGEKQSATEAQWRSSLTAQACPLIGNKPARDVTTADVLAILTPIWATRTETATRVRERIEAVLDATRVREGWPSPFENPARWKGHLAHVLPRPERVSSIVHFRAMDAGDVAAFSNRLHVEQRGVGALALRYTILTAARSGMVRLATWKDINEDDAIWEIPAQNMKAGEGFRVPLSAPALAIIQTMRKLRSGHGGDYIFPGQKRGEPLSEGAMLSVLTRMKVPVDVHGFRSTFRDWAGEETDHKSDVTEAALDHVLPGGATRAAYQRGDLLKKRRDLMSDWATFLTT